VAGGVIGAVIILTQEPYPSSWGLIGATWTGMAVLGRSKWQAMSILAGAVVFCALTAGDEAIGPVGGGGLLAAGGGEGVGSAAYYGIMCAIMYFANWFQLWFWAVVKAANEGKEALARLAVTEERLRFSRDMHDLVGHSLSAIAVKSEVATKLAAVDADRAVAEMAEVRRLAREALREIRMAVRGYRTVELGAELRSIRAVLEAAGIRCALTVPETELPDQLGTLLAWVVREGTTNVLRHSTATQCRIEVRTNGEHITLEMVNDGPVVNEEKPGTGLAGLAERLAPLGGVLTAGNGKPGEFVLRATVPMGGTR
jgi:two-component system sensor histidine kinase DesK